MVSSAGAVNCRADRHGPSHIRRAGRAWRQLESSADQPSHQPARFDVCHCRSCGRSLFHRPCDHNDHLRETGLLSAEALIDSGIVVTALKTASQRQRPAVDHSSGEFFDGGSSFPSGHASSAWSVATVIAQEYGHHRPLVQVAAYGLATAVSLSRYTGRNHFLSEVLVGSAIGYATGRYVYHKHHDTALDAQNEKQNDNDVVRSKLFPRIAPLYYPRAHVYGGMLAWNF